MLHVERVAVAERVEVERLMGIEEIGLDYVFVTANAFTYPVMGIDGCDMKDVPTPCILVKPENELTYKAKLALCGAKSAKVDTMYNPTEQSVVRAKLYSLLGLSCITGTNANGYLIRIPSEGSEVYGELFLDIITNVNRTNNIVMLNSLVSLLVESKMEEFNRLMKMQDELGKRDDLNGSHEGGYGFWLSAFYEGLETGVMMTEYNDYKEYLSGSNVVINGLVEAGGTLENSFNYTGALQEVRGMTFDIYVEDTKPMFYNEEECKNRDDFATVVRQLGEFEVGTPAESLSIRIGTKAKYADVKRGLYGKNVVCLDEEREFLLMGNQDVYVEYNYLIKYSDLGKLQEVLFAGYDFIYDFEAHCQFTEAVRFTTTI